MKIRSIAIVAIVVVVGIVIAISRACSVTVAEVAEEQEERYELNRIVKDEYSANECFAPMEKYIARWMARNEIKGATLAIMKDERLIYCKGLGWADEQLQRLVELASAKGVEYDEAGFILSKELMRTQLSAMVAQRLFSTSEYYRYINPRINDSYKRVISIISEKTTPYDQLLKSLLY